MLEAAYLKRAGLSHTERNVSLLYRHVAVCLPQAAERRPTGRGSHHAEPGDLRRLDADAARRALTAVAESGNLNGSTHLPPSTS